MEEGKKDVKVKTPVVVVERSLGERVRNLIKDLLLNNVKVESNEYEVFFPISDVEEARKRLIWNGIKFKIREIEGRRKKKKDDVANIIKKYIKQKKRKEKLNIGIDRVGDIVILNTNGEISDEEELGKELISSGIKALYIKESGRKGKFRLEKLRVLKGMPDEPLTIHKENNYSLFVDVKKVYFSPRLGNDRIEAREIVEKNGGDVLVMFSGLGPYMVSIGKAKKGVVAGIELNIEGHLLSKKNGRLNKLPNYIAMLGNAKNTWNVINEYMLGIKSSWKKNQLVRRIRKCKTKVIEIYVGKEELEEEELKSVVDQLIKKDYRVFIHAPTKQFGENISVVNAKNIIKTIKILDNYIEKGVEGIIIHPTHKKTDKKDFIENLEFLEKRVKNKERFFIENLIKVNEDSWESDIGFIERVSKSFGFGFCLDISHGMISGYTLEEMKDITNRHNGLTHIHLSMGKKNDNNIEEGLMISKEDAPDIIRFLRATRHLSAIVEVLSKDENKGTEEIKSYNNLLNYLKKKRIGSATFEHVFMPLPKDSDLYLGEALKHVSERNKAWIHLYKFYGENINEFTEKILKKYNNLKIINIKETGQHSPRVWRYRIDIEVERKERR